MLWIEQTSAFFKTVDLGNIFFSQMDLCEGHILTESRNLGRLDERDAHALYVPCQNDLGSGLAFGDSNLSDHGVSKAINIFKLVGTKLPVARSDSGVSLDVDAPFLVELEHLGLVQVGVDLNLVNYGLDPTTGKYISELRHHAVAQTN